MITIVHAYLIIPEACLLRVARLSRLYAEPWHTPLGIRLCFTLRRIIVQVPGMHLSPRSENQSWLSLPRHDNGLPFQRLSAYP